VKVIIVSGPTASGKTDISIELARKFGGEIINFDSLLLYKEINIGTAKPTLTERGEIPHHMIDVASISHPMNAAAYAKMALPIINDLHAKNKLVYLVGGSGFYLQALVKGMYDSPTTPKEISEQSETLYLELGILPFLEILQKEDPTTFALYHENDHYAYVGQLSTSGIPEYLFLLSAHAKTRKMNYASNPTFMAGTFFICIWIFLKKNISKSSKTERKR